MVDKEQQRVISILRAVLVSNSKKGSMSLAELEHDYYLLEGEKQIPTFQYKSVGHFLHCTGEFILNTENGVVVVREKPKLESLHVKKLVEEQKSPAKYRSFVKPRKIASSPVHNTKPSVVFTFDQLQANRNSSKISTFNSLNESKLKSLSNEANCLYKTSTLNLTKKPQHDGKPTVEFSFDKVKKETSSSLLSDERNIEHQSITTRNRFNHDTSLIDGNSSHTKRLSLRDSSTQTDLTWRQQLLVTILPFYVNKTHTGLYYASVTINEDNYIGYGSNENEAKNSAAAKALKCMTELQKNKARNQKNKIEVKPISLCYDDTFNGNSFYILKQLKRSLQYHCKQMESFYFSSLMVDGVEYNASGATASTANNKVASKVLNSMLARAGEEEKDWLLEKIEEIKVSLSDVANKTTMKCGMVTKLEEASNEYFNELKNMFYGLYYQTVGYDGNNFRVMVEVESVPYYGVGETHKEANNNAAKKCLQSIRNGDHRKAVDYWYWY